MELWEVHSFCQVTSEAPINPILCSAMLSMFTERLCYALRVCRTFVLGVGAFLRQLCCAFHIVK